jgi:hypothetical protein
MGGDASNETYARCAQIDGSLIRNEPESRSGTREALVETLRHTRRGHRT